jgi:hypothetical protein
MTNKIITITDPWAASTGAGVAQWMSMTRRATSAPSARPGSAARRGSRTPD